MRALVRGILIWGMAILPQCIRKHLIYTLCEAVKKNSDVKQNLIELFEFNDILEECLDSQSIKYEGGIHPKHRLMDYHRFFCDRISSDERVLDVGCGYGSVAASIAESGAWVTAVDLKEENIVKAKERYACNNLEFLVMDVTKKIPDGAYDVVVLSNVLEHIEDRPRFLKTIAQLATPKKWLIRVPRIDRDWQVPLRRELGLSYFSDPTHYTEYTVEKFKLELLAGGLSVVSIQFCWGEIWAEAKQDG